MNTVKQYSWCFYALFLLFLPAFSYASVIPDFQCKLPLKSPEVLFLVPDDRPNLYWDSAVKFAKQASQQLGIKLRIHAFEGGRGVQSFTNDLEKLLNHIDKPDYVVSFLWQKREKKVIELFKRHDIKFITTDFTINDKLIGLVGEPRQKYKNWIGHLAADDYQVGYDIMSFLIDEYPKKIDKKPTLLAITGSHGNDSSSEKLRGVLTKVKESGDVELLQYVYSDWTSAHGEYLTDKLLKRYKTVDMIWSASDIMTVGIVKALNKSSLTPDNEVMVGSVDWSPEVISLIKESKVTVSFGGHILNTAYILALILDYHNGYDFEPALGTIIKTNLYPVSKKSIDILTEKNFSSLNFSLLSKCLSKGDAIEINSFIPTQLLNLN